MSALATVRRRVLGVGFLATIVGMLALSILFYNHAFTKTVDVTLYVGCQPPPAAAGTATNTNAETAADTIPAAAQAAMPVCTTTSAQNNSAGHELDTPADVKLRGIEVGQVTDITLADSSRRAVLHLKLMPSQVGNIPANVSAEIIPKTLFGEKYVDLVIPKNPSPTDIAQGSRTIVQSATSIEAEQVFNDLLPLLQTVQPAELNTTLSNLAQALRGRGNLLGQNLVNTDTYFSGLNPDLPTITSDVGGLQTLAQNLNDAAPDILAQARQFSVNARTLVAKGDVLANFLTGTEGFANTATAVLTRNETNLVALANISQPTLAVLAEFSPEYTCTLQGLSDQATLLKQAISPHGADNQYALHINVTVPQDNARHAYTTADTPKNEAQNVKTAFPNSYQALDGPCFGLPAHRTTAIPGYLPINGTPTPGTPHSDTGSSAAPASALGTSPLTMARILAAPQLGVSGSNVPDLAALLLAPALAGGPLSVTSGGRVVNGKTIRSAVYLVVFAVITLALTYVLAVTISNGSVGSTASYSAQFSDTTGLLVGDDVRVAGVRVGQVQSIVLKENCPSHVNAAGVRTTACSQVRFGLAKSVPLQDNAEIDVRYRNLVGQRYLDVVQTPGAAPTVRPGSMVPLARTKPALDLTVLFDGFKPLFQALDPTATNTIAYEIVSTLQGEGGNLNSLLANTASLSSSIASQDSAIGSLIDNLTGVLATVDSRDGELTNLVDQLQRLVTGLAGSRDAIASSLSNVDLLASSTTRLLATIRPYLPTDLTQLSGVANTLATTTIVNVQGQRQNQLDEFLNRFPGKLQTITRTASYGGFFNFYLCRVNAQIGGTTVAVVNNNTRICEQPS